MSAGTYCQRSADHRYENWRITMHRANASVFNGGRRTRSDFSQIVCTACQFSTWRTKASYVSGLPCHDPGCRDCPKV